jgi:hypothetical protein
MYLVLVMQGILRTLRCHAKKKSKKPTISKTPTTLHESSTHIKRGQWRTFPLKKVQVKFSLFMPHRHVGEVVIIAALTLSAGTRWKRVVNFMPRQIYSQCPVNIRFGETTANLGILWKRKILCPWQESTPSTSSP